MIDLIVLVAKLLREAGLFVSFCAVLLVAMGFVVFGLYLLRRSA